MNKTLTRDKRSRRPAAQTAAPTRPPWSARKKLAAFAGAVVGMLAIWYILYPEDFQRIRRDVAAAVGGGAAPEAAEPTPRVNAAQPPGPAPEGMAWVPGGTFYMGSEENPDSQPVHPVEVDGFWMDKHEVSNARFAKFVEETGYKTIAERQPDLKDFPHLRPEALGFQLEYPAALAVAPTAGPLGAMPWGAVAQVYPILEPFSLVFTRPPFVLDLDDHKQWWRPVVGANWRHPDGPGSSIKGRENHPAVHICWDDAVAYCEWKSKKEGAKYRLPTEAEWEFAARGGLDRKKYCWGDELEPAGKCMANIWQGEFPRENTLKDGHYATAPVGSYPANAFGLHDLSGNVWEWCHDWYRPEYYKGSPRRNPRGPAGSADPREPGVPKRVQRGGSFLCADNYCMRYLPCARGKGEPTSAASHIGFRCVRDAK